MGPARSITNFDNFIHIINLEDYKANIDDIETTIALFEKHTSETNIEKVTTLKLRELKNKFLTLYPTQRQKRGLFNGLGSAIKVITGNMDAQDAQTINEQIANVYTNLNNVTNTLSLQHSINFKMMERFKNITTHINNEQHIIEKYITNTANRIQHEEDIIIRTQYLNQVNFNIDLLTNHLSNIAEAVVLSKLNIISRFLLSPEELDIIELKLRTQGIKIESIENIYEMLGMQAYYNKSNIIFNILIPNISNEKYFLYHIIPLPIYETKIVKTEPYITFNENSTQHHKTLCPKIEGTYYCNKPIKQEDTRNSICIGNLMNNKAASCPLNDVGKIESILQAEPNYILFINSPETLINSTCSTKTFKVEGTALIHFQHCDVSINGITYHDDADTFWDQIHIPPLPNSNVSANSTTEVLNLKKLKDLNIQTDSRVNKLEVTTTTIHSITTSSTIVCTIIVITILIIVIKRRNSYKHLLPDLQYVAPAPTTSFWPSLYLKGGGVTTPTTPTTTTTTTLPPPKPQRAKC